VRLDEESHDEEEDLNEGMLKSIVKSIFLRNRLRKKDQEPAVTEEHAADSETLE
jgi:hypothetical protein